MKEVKINGKLYPSYATTAEADTYANASITAEDWDATTADNKGRALVEATRLLDRQRWRPPFDLRVEREASDTVRVATIEIAILVAGGAVDVLTAGSTNDLIKRLRAGSVEIEYSGKSNAAARFPAHIVELLAGLVDLAVSAPAGVALGGGAAFGTDGRTEIGTSYGVTRG